LAHCSGHQAHALTIAGPVREYYLVDARNTSDATQWRTEIGWPIFQTAKERSKRKSNRLFIKR
jgi:hypothetical protein